MPKQLKAHGLPTEPLRVDRRRADCRSSGTTPARRASATWSGRSARVCRKIATRDGRRPRRSAATVGPEQIREYLGRPRFFYEELAARTAQPGVAIGVGVTGVGGDIMFIEATRMPGKGSLTVTGQLGDVMQESAHGGAVVRALAGARISAIDPDFFKESDIHIHVPAGAIPKDGPSAGMAMTTALVSLLTGVPVRDDVAMTGEITLRGQVLPVGGIKEKALAARRAGRRRPSSCRSATRPIWTICRRSCGRR